LFDVSLLSQFFYLAVEGKIYVRAYQEQKDKREYVNGYLSPYIFFSYSFPKWKKINFDHLSPILRNARPIETAAIGP